MRDIIFDLDGTIVDSSECIFSVYTMLLKEIGVPKPDAKTMRSFIGPPIELTIGDYVEKDKIPAMCTRFREIYKTLDLSKVNKLYDGITELFDKLLNAGKRLFIATSKNEPVAKKLCDSFDITKYFTAIYGSRHEIGRLTKLDVLEQLLDDYNVSKTDCVLVGDTHYDAEGANQADIPVAIVKYGFGDEEKLKEFNVLFYAGTPLEVFDKISKY